MFKNDIKDIYNNYLGQFNVNWSNSDLEYLKKIIPDLYIKNEQNSMYIQGTRNDLKKVAKYLLLYKGKQFFKHLIAYEIIFAYFKENPVQDNSEDTDAMGWFDQYIDLYLISYLQNTPENKMLIPAIAYLTDTRINNNKTTILLTELHLESLKPLYNTQIILNFPSDKQKIIIEPELKINQEERKEDLVILDDQMVLRNKKVKKYGKK